MWVGLGVREFGFQVGKGGEGVGGGVVGVGEVMGWG